MERQITIEHGNGRRLTDVGDGFAVLDDFDAVVVDADLPYDVAVHVKIANGVLTCTSLEARQRDDGPLVTSAGIRQIPVADVLRSVAAYADEWAMKGSTAEGYSWPLNGGERSAYLQRRRRAERKGRRRITDDELELVAKTYRAAMARGQAPTVAVQVELHLNTREQAARWVRKAREAGHLEPAPGPRMKGEAR